MRDHTQSINVIELNIGDISLDIFPTCHYNSDRQIRLLNVLGQIAMILGDKKNRHLLSPTGGTGSVVKVEFAVSAHMSLPSTKLHCFTSQKAVILIPTLQSQISRL